MAASDTSAAAREVQLRIQRGLTAVDRLRIAVDMSLTARELSATRLRSEHPEWSEADIVRQLLRQAFSGGKVPPQLR